MEVIFFPRNDYPDNVEVCSHRYGKKMAYTEQTDTQQNTGSFLSYQWLVPYAKSKGIKVGIFASVSSPIVDTGGIKNDYDNGDIWLDVYSLVPTLQSYITPADQTDQITKEIWDEAYNTYILPNFQNFTGKKPVAMSYSYGRDKFKDLITQLLGARNSDKSTPPNYITDYGVGYGNPNTMPYSFDRFKSKASTTRWYDTEKEKSTPDWPAAISAQGDLIDATILNHGWLNNFTHWHSVKNDGNQSIYEDYLDMLAEKNDNNEIWFCGYGEALAYLVYRQMIKDDKVVMYSPIANADSQLVIQLETDNSSLQVDADLLQVPISINFSTVGTPLAGQSITSDCNLISLGSGDYIVEIPFSRFPRAIIEKQV